MAAHDQPGHNEPSVASAASMWLFSLPAAWLLHDFALVSWPVVAIIWLAWLWASWLIAESMTCRNANTLSSRDQSRALLLAGGPWLAVGSYYMFYIDPATTTGAVILLAALVAWVFHAFRGTPNS